GCLHRQPAERFSHRRRLRGAHGQGARGPAPAVGHDVEPYRRERQREPAAVAPSGAGTGTTRSLPAALASYMAKSATRMTSSRVAPCIGNTATPIDAVTLLPFKTGFLAGRGARISSAT